MNKFLSRKWIAMILALIAIGIIVYLRGQGMEISDETMWAVVLAVATFVAPEGVADIITRLRQPSVPKINDIVSGLQDMEFPKDVIKAAVDNAEKKGISKLQFPKDLLPFWNDDK